MSTERAVIVFDGVCTLCNGWVHFLLERDRARRFGFAAMQGMHGRELLATHGLDPDDPASFLLIDAAGAWRDSEVIARVLAGLGTRWRIMAWLLMRLPRSLRDRGYALVARNRYRWFGRRQACMLPPAGEADRFLD